LRVLILDTEDGQGLDLAVRAVDAGHEVRLYEFSTKPVRHGEGFPGIKHVATWRESMPWVGKDGLIFVTGNWRFLFELERYRDLGFKIFAPSVRSARLEIDRGAGMELLRAHGIDMPPYETFDSLEAAEKFARKSDRAWVAKPMGDESDKSLTYVAHDPADLVGWLRRQMAAGKKLKGQLMLQQKIEVLSELGVSGWMGPEGFLPEKFQVSVEHKKLMPGEVGPATGEMGTICQYVESDKLAEEMLLPLEPALRALGHCGDFSVGAMIGRDGKAYPLEFTARAGWPAFHIQVASHRGDPVQWMRDLLDGKDSLRVSYDAAIGVVMAQPRFPYGGTPEELAIGNPIEGVVENYEDLHCVNVLLGKGPMMKDGRVVEGPVYQTSGEYVLVATALGKTVERARSKVYRTIKEVRFPNAIYRDDVGEKVTAAADELHRHGYALDLS
jgi:phosphoribosylamine--glycine ligase